MFSAGGSATLRRISAPEYDQLAEIFRFFEKNRNGLSWLVLVPLREVKYYLALCDRLVDRRESDEERGLKINNFEFPVSLEKKLLHDMSVIIALKRDTLPSKFIKALVCNSFSFTFMFALLYTSKSGLQMVSAWKFGI